MIRLTRSEPSRNMHRFYALQLAPTLFGEWALVAEWGRIGSSGKVMHAVFETEELAQNALDKRLRSKTKRRDTSRKGNLRLLRLQARV